MIVAEREGFEPSVPLLARRFSRPVPSTTRSPLHAHVILTEICHNMNMNDSIFTKIIKGEIPSYKIYEDDIVLAFLDIHPVQPGHILVVPKQQVDKLEDVEETIYLHLMTTVKKLMLHIREKLQSPRVTMKVEGFDVPHAHIHLIPCQTASDFWNKVRMDEPIDHDALTKMHSRLTLI